MDSADDIHAQRIRSLPLWSGPVRLQHLEGGITNRNYLVDDANEKYVARIGEELLVLGIDRRNELQCHRAAEALGVAPPVVYGEDGVLVSRYVPSRTLDPAGAREPGFAPRLARVLRQLHDGWDALIGDLLFFSPFQASRTYVATLRQLGAALPADIDLILDTTRKLSRTIAPYVPTLCHNDMLPANVLDDGRRVWIVDWEYAGMGHPLFDLAGFRPTVITPKSKMPNFSRVIGASSDEMTCTSFMSSRSRAYFEMLSGEWCKQQPPTSTSTTTSTPVFTSRNSAKPWQQQRGQDPI